MSKMVERVALTLRTHFAGEKRPSWDSLARASIEAMREPTEAMDEACRTSTDDYVGGLVTWRLMIDAALGKETA